MITCKRTFLYKFNLKATDTIPNWIGVAKLCEHAEQCPQLKYLSKSQLDLFKALQSCDLNKVLSFDWVLIYNSLKTFETLGLITYPEEIVSSVQLSKYTIKQLEKRTCNCKLVS